MSDCDNCIYLDQDNNGEYCHKGHTGHKTLITMTVVTMNTGTP